MNAANVPGPLQVKPAYPIAGNAVLIIIAARQRQKDEFDELFLTTRQLFAKSKQSKAMLAKRVHSDRDGTPIWPKGCVAFELDRFGLPIP
jgi:hypothetical protein